MARLASLIVIVSMLVAASTAAGARAKPHLKVTATAPVTVSATGFRSRERVTVVLRVDQASARRIVRATARGTFTVTFPGMSVDRCSGGLTARAVGSGGSEAVTKLGPLPQCPPAP